MKKLILILLLSTNFLYSQNSLTVTILHCKDLDDTYVFGFDEIVLYKNDSIYKIDNSNIEVKFFENLPEGKYNIKYKTFFGEVVSESFDLNSKKPTHSVDLCIDELKKEIRNETKNLFIHRLKNDESIITSCNYSGCFSGSSHQMTITKKNDKLYLTYNGINKKLNKNEISRLTDYEMELRNLKEANFMSTSNQSNEMKYKEEIISFKINPFWSGFQNLKNGLNLK